MSWLSASEVEGMSQIRRQKGQPLRFGTGKSLQAINIFRYVTELMNHVDELISYYTRLYEGHKSSYLKKTTSYYIYISISFREQPEGLVDGRTGFTP